MDIEKFNKWSDQLETMLNKLVEDKQNLQAVRERQLADYSAVNNCITQVAVEKQLRKMANDIRALGFCYNNLRDSIHMSAEQFDTLE